MTFYIFIFILGRDLYMATSWADALFENQMVGVIQTINRTIVKVNNVFTNLFDYSEKEIINQNTSILYNSYDDFQKYGNQIYQAFDLPIPVTIPEVMWKTRTGEQKWVQLIGHFIDKNDNNVIWLVIDINNRKELETHLEMALAEHHAILNNAITGIVYIKDRKILEFNKTFAEIFGFERDELLHQDVRLLFVNDDDYNQVGKKAYPIIDELGSYASEQRFQKKDGTVFWVFYGAKAIVPNRSSEGTIWVVNDISERKKAEALLIAERNKANVTLSSIGDAVITTDTLGIVEYMNPVAASMVGLTLEQAVGKPLYEVFRIVNEKTNIPVASPVDRVLREGIVVGLANHTLLLSHDGSSYAIEDSAAPIVDHDQHIIGCVLVFHDVTEKRHWNDQMEWQANHDVLTGLSNRTRFIEHLNHAMKNAETDGYKLAIALLDLDNFKIINDHYGHALGDQLLIQVANRLIASVSEQDLIARLGGDEFVLLLNHIDSFQDAFERLEHMKQQLLEPFWIQGISLTVNASMGTTFFPDDSGDSDTLLRHIDQAMYTAKQLGRNRIYVYDLLQEEARNIRYQQLFRLRSALQNEEFTLYYQPKVNLLRKTLVGLEALIRWNHPEKGLVMPGEFLPVIADDPFMLDLGRWVMETALKQIASWNQLHLTTKVSINIPAQQLLHDDFISDVEFMLTEYPTVAPHQLEMEILETDALKDVDKVQSVILHLQKKGIRFSLDDFGTGYSSLAYMKHLPVDILKIDRSFIVDMLEDEQELAIVQGIIGMAKVFRKDLIAEGIENDSQSAALIALGCENGQGYWIGRPMPADKVRDWVDHFQSSVKS